MRWWLHCFKILYLPPVAMVVSTLFPDREMRSSWLLEVLTIKPSAVSSVHPAPLPFPDPFLNIAISLGNPLFRKQFVVGSFSALHSYFPCDLTVLLWNGSSWKCTSSSTSSSRTHSPPPSPSRNAYFTLIGVEYGSWWFLLKGSCIFEAANHYLVSAGNNVFPTLFPIHHRLLPSSSHVFCIFRRSFLHIDPNAIRFFKQYGCGYSHLFLHSFPPFCAGLYLFLAQVLYSIPGTSSTSLVSVMLLTLSVVSR